jgi:hypothetical protein
MNRSGDGPDSRAEPRIIHEYPREAFETESRLGFSHVRPTQAYLQSARRPNENSLAGREDRPPEQVHE